MPHEIHAANKSTKDKKADSKALDVHQDMVQPGLVAPPATFRIYAKPKGGTPEVREPHTIKFGDSVNINGRVWVFYDSSKTEHTDLFDSKRDVDTFLRNHPNGRVCIGLSPDGPTKLVT